MDISITILDINDNGPVFEDKKSNQITLTEGTINRITPPFDNINTPSTQFYMCEAFDDDTDTYSADINEYTIVDITPCKCDCNDPDCRIDNSDNADFQAAKLAVGTSFECNSKSPGTVEFNVAKDYTGENSLPESNIGLNREDIGFYRITVSVADKNCEEGSTGCVEELCHNCETTEVKFIYVTVDDINDSGPEILDTAKDLTIPAGSTSGYNIPESLRIRDNDVNELFKISEAIIVNQELRCASGSCNNEKSYFEIISSNRPGADSNFTLRTKENIPAYEDVNFFTEVVLTVTRS